MSALQPQATQATEIDKIRRAAGSEGRKVRREVATALMKVQGMAMVTSAAVNLFAEMDQQLQELAQNNPNVAAARDVLEAGFIQKIGAIQQGMYKEQPSNLLGF